MKKLTLGAIILMGASFTNYTQTNRISHYSHSGSSATLSIFAAADNMGCGEALRGEYVPDTTQKPVIKLEETDTTKTSVKNKIEIPQSKAPRKGMSLEQHYNIRATRKN